MRRGGIEEAMVRGSSATLAAHQDHRQKDVSIGCEARVPIGIETLERARVIGSRLNEIALALNGRLSHVSRDDLSNIPSSDEKVARHFPAYFNEMRIEFDGMDASLDLLEGILSRLEV